MSQAGLVSFLIIAYEQERFIREAVRGALNQTYEPLEIVVSDDCSPDRTFDVIKEEVQAYRGPHKVILNRNETNVGLAGNLNAAWSLSHGEFVVAQGGDDISLPQRTEALLKAWREPTPVDCVFSDYALIDASGHILTPSRFGERGPNYSATLAEFTKSQWCWIPGCSAAYSAHLNPDYGYLPQGLLAEDSVLAFRALLGRGIRYVPVPLVQYRVHDGNVYHGRGLDVGTATPEAKRRWNADRARVAQEWIRCLEVHGNGHNGCGRIVADMERQKRYESLAFQSPRWAVPYLALKGLAEGLPLRKAAGLLHRHFFHTNQ